MPRPSPDPRPYRPCVGIALFNQTGEVFVGERIDTPGSWQMPQGGIEPGENIEQAAMRELAEETGTGKGEIIRVHGTTIRYNIPNAVLKKLNLWDGKYAGQEQTWVAMRFTGQDPDIRISGGDHPEFSQWKWVRLEDTLSLIVPFKKDVYRQVIAAFHDLAIPQRTE